MDTNKSVEFLKSVGLWKAINGYPALYVLILVTIALLELIAAEVVQLLPSLTASSLQVFIVIVGTLLGLTGYFAGDFWDSRFFDPRYGLRGKWRHSHTRPLNVFPAGSDLNEYRDKAIQTLFGKEHSGEGIYREAKKVAKKQARKWEYIEQPLILSKFVRSFIWPCFLISISVLAAAGGSFLYDWGLNVTTLIGAGVISFCFGLLLFIPYFQLRVEHMIRLYEYVPEYISKKKASED